MFREQDRRILHKVYAVLVFVGVEKRSELSFNGLRGEDSSLMVGFNILLREYESGLPMVFADGE